MNGAGDRTRTDIVLLPRDFESRASTNFATPAYIYVFGSIQASFILSVTALATTEPEGSVNYTGYSICPQLIAPKVKTSREYNRIGLYPT